MAECNACGREAGINRVYCNDKCFQLANSPHPATRIAEAEPRFSTENPLHRAMRIERDKAYFEIAKLARENADLKARVQNLEAALRNERESVCRVLWPEREEK